MLKRVARHSRQRKDVLALFTNFLLAPISLWLNSLPHFSQWLMEDRPPLHEIQHNRKVPIPIRP
jgi:hypothetical protein